MAMRNDQTRQTLAPRAGALDVLKAIRTDGYPIGVLTDCTAETPELWPSLPYSAVVDAVPSRVRSAKESHIRPATATSVASSASPPKSASTWAMEAGELSGATSAGMTAVLLETPFGTDFRHDAESCCTGRSVSYTHQVRRVLRDLSLEGA